MACEPSEQPRLGEDNMTTNQSSTDDFVRACAREWKERGSSPPPLADDDSTLVALDGTAFLAHRLGRRPTPEEVDLFWTEIAG